MCIWSKNIEDGQKHTVLSNFNPECRQCQTEVIKCHNKWPEFDFIMLLKSGKNNLYTCTLKVLTLLCICYCTLQDEFCRITMVHLESKFMSKLDEYTPRLLAIFHSKGRTGGFKMCPALIGSAVWYSFGIKALDLYTYGAEGTCLVGAMDPPLNYLN